MGDVVMPRLSDTMEEGTILRWYKRDGDQVHHGEELLEIETDKASMSYESDQDGVLQTLAAEGDTLAVGEVIARIGLPIGEPDPQGSDGDEPAVRPAGVRAQGEPDGARGAEAVESPPAGGAPAPGAEIVPDGSPGPVTEAVPDGAPASADAATGERVKASPLARRIARERGVDLRALTGSGPGGRIVKADVHQAGAVARAGAPTPAGASTSTAAADRTAGPSPATAALERVATAKGESTTIALSRTQQTIARRMAESKATIPDFTLQVEVDMEDCAKLRTKLKGISRDEAPTYNDMVVKAAALALRDHPRANGSYRDGQLELHSRVNVGVAVATEDALLVPTVFDAEEKSLGEIARETRALAERVRGGTITPPELGGGTFTVSNLGMYGVKAFTAIINPPQAAILSVGSLSPRAVVRKGKVVSRHTMTLTLVCDHRILYGADAAQFLARIRELLQSPSALTL